MQNMNDKIADDCIRLVPDTMYNVTFNRLSPDCSTQWNSWSAGGRDDNNIIKCYQGIMDMEAAQADMVRKHIIAIAYLINIIREVRGQSYL